MVSTIKILSILGFLVLLCHISHAENEEREEDKRETSPGRFRPFGIGRSLDVQRQLSGRLRPFGVFGRSLSKQSARSPGGTRPFGVIGRSLSAQEQLPRWRPFGVGKRSPKSGRWRPFGIGKRSPKTRCRLGMWNCIKRSFEQKQIGPPAYQKLENNIDGSNEVIKRGSSADH